MNDTELQALIARNPNHPKYGVPVPLILICNVTGKETKYTAPEYIKGKLEAAGSLENLLRNYKCKGAGKEGAATAPKSNVPKSKSTWRGETVNVEKKESKAEEVSSGPVDLIHRTFLTDNGPPCHVYHPRQNPEQLSEIEHDFRRKK